MDSLLSKEAYEAAEQKGFAGSLIREQLDARLKSQGKASLSAYQPYMSYARNPLAKLFLEESWSQIKESEATRSGDRQLRELASRATAVKESVESLAAIRDSLASELTKLNVQPSADSGDPVREKHGRLEATLTDVSALLVDDFDKIAREHVALAKNEEHVSTLGKRLREDELDAEWNLSLAGLDKKLLKKLKDEGVALDAERDLQELKIEHMCTHAALARSETAALKESMRMKQAECDEKLRVIQTEGPGMVAAAKESALTRRSAEVARSRVITAHVKEIDAGFTWAMNQEEKEKEVEDMAMQHEQDAGGQYIPFDLGGEGGAGQQQDDDQNCSGAGAGRSEGQSRDTLMTDNAEL